MLDIQRLKSEILTELVNQGFQITVTGNNNDVLWIERFALAIATAVITEIKTNAEVTNPGGSYPHTHVPGTVI